MPIVLPEFWAVFAVGVQFKMRPTAANYVQCERALNLKVELDYI